MRKEEIVAAFREYAEKQNAGIKKYQEIHPDYDPSPFIIPDWKRER